MVEDQILNSEEAALGQETECQASKFEDHILGSHKVLVGQRDWMLDKGDWMLDKEDLKTRRFQARKS